MTLSPSCVCVRTVPTYKHKYEQKQKNAIIFRFLMVSIFLCERMRSMKGEKVKPITQKCFQRHKIIEHT